MYFVACLWFKKEKAQKCASDLLTKAQSEKRKVKSAKRKAKAQFIKPHLSLCLWLGRNVLYLQVLISNSECSGLTSPSAVAQCCERSPGVAAARPRFSVLFRDGCHYVIMTTHSFSDGLTFCYLVMSCILLHLLINILQNAS